METNKIERANAFVMRCCDDPHCALHLVPERNNGAPICELTISRHALREILKVIHEEGLDLE